jgi:transposase
VTYRCHHCGNATTSAFPETVAAHVQYGPCLRAIAFYLNAQHWISDRVCEAMADLSATASLCPASVSPR